MSYAKLAFLIFGLNHLVDYGFHEGVTLDEVEQHIRKGDVLDWLGQRFEGHIDVSVYLHNREAYREITTGLQEILGAYAGQERRKWGVKNNGICLLIAWTAELVQQRALKEEGVVA
jgi:hypothetical protein